MNDLSQTRLWLMRLAFIALAMLLLFFNLLPLETTPRRIAGPDLLLAFACAWCLRRPEYVPAISLAGVFLLADLLLQRPPGLFAMLALLGCENLKGRGRSLRDSSFAAEWFTVALIVTLITVAYRLALSLVILPLPSLPLSLSELAMTLLFYPLIVLITHGLMGVRKYAPGELDALGQRV
jgi:rod shape-determining protein MreD